MPVGISILGLGLGLGLALLGLAMLGLALLGLAPVRKIVKPVFMFLNMILMKKRHFQVLGT